MSDLSDRLNRLEEAQSNARLRIITMGSFEVSVDDRTVTPTDWGRDKSIQLFQFLVTNRSRKGLHKEQIISRLWENLNSDEGDRNFKVALHGVNKALEPQRLPRTDPAYVLRQGSSYQLNLNMTWIDALAMEELISLAYEALNDQVDLAIRALRAAIHLHHGIYLPNRIYEDWTTEERERLQVLVLGAYLTLAENLLIHAPLETVRLTEEALQIDNTWEDAYYLQMKAYNQRGNRPAAIKTFRRCVQVLDREFGLDPLPETQKLFDSISQ